MYPTVYAVRHAESVANVLKHDSELEYYKRAWLDDSDRPAEAEK